MQSPSKLKKHADLVDRMATAHGVDLEEQMFRGRLSTSELDDAVLRCTGCTQPEACSHWLAAQEAPEQKAQQGARDAVTAPHYCRNAELLEALLRDCGNG